MLSELRPKLSPYIEKIASPFMGIHPSIISVVGLIFPILFVFALVAHNNVLALVLLLLSTLDMVDGAVARKTGKVTAFGGVLDSSLDRVSDSLIIISFSLAGFVYWEISVSLLILSFLISYLRSRAELAAKGAIVLNVGIVERPERLLMIGLVLLLIQLTGNPVYSSLRLADYGFIVITILSFITVIQRFLAAYKRLKNL